MHLGLDGTPETQRSCELVINDIESELTSSVGLPGLQPWDKNLRRDIKNEDMKPTAQWLEDHFGGLSLRKEWDMDG